MSKLIRFDDSHFGYLLDEGQPLDRDMARRLAIGFAQAWPGITLIVMQADGFLDLTGQSSVLGTFTSGSPTFKLD